MSKSLESMPGAVFTLFSSVPLSMWNTFFSPAPSYQSDDVSPRQLLLPLGQFGAVMAISVWWCQLWLFTVAALGFVWIDTQMAFKINKKFKTSQLRYNTLVAESILNAQRLRPTFVDRDSDIEKRLPISKPLQIFSHKDFMASHFGSGGITTSAVCVFPAQVMANRLSAAQQAELEAEIAGSLQTQLQQQQQPPHALCTVHEEDYASAPTAISDMEAVQQELAQVLARRAPNEDESSSSLYSQSCHSIENLFRPMHPPPTDDDGVSHLTSLEDLDLDLWDRIRPGTSSSTYSTSSSGTTGSSHTEPRREYTFPIIDNILFSASPTPSLDNILSSASPTPSLHSISLDAIRPLSTLFTTEDELSSDEARDSDGIFSPPRSRPESPTTSVSNYSGDDDDDDHKVNDVDVLPPAPATRMQHAPAIAPAQRPPLAVTGITRPISPQRPALRRAATSQKSRKNNGWKKVPKKARLSKSAKKRFVSRAFW